MASDSVENEAEVVEGAAAPTRSGLDIVRLQLRMLLLLLLLRLRVKRKLLVLLAPQLLLP